MEDLTTSQMSNNGIDLSAISNTASLSGSNSAKNKKLFPQKLWDLINEDSYNFCLRWSDDGQLVYLNRDEFEDSYLKTAENQFHTQKAISFVRQMNMYGFRKVDDCYYENDNFKRDCEYLLKNMIRKHPSKNSAINCISNDLKIAHHATSIPYRSNNPDSLLQSPGVIVPTSNDCCDKNNDCQQQSIQHSTLDDANSNFNNVFYALLSSLNNNFYQSHLAQAANDQQHQNQILDINRYASIQQIYQHFLEQQQHQNELSHVLIPPSQLKQDSILNLPQQTQSIDAILGRTPPPPPPAGNVMSAISLLSGNKKDSIKNEPIKYANSLETLSTSHQTCTTYNDRPLQLDHKTVQDYNKSANNNAESLIIKKRENKVNRSFKRSIDSILNNNTSSQSNGNESIERAEVHKRIRIDSDSEDYNAKDEYQVNQVHLHRYAKNLVIKVAAAKDIRLDKNVISEASEYTERFVGILFETAQVIARHSYCSSNLTPSDSLNTIVHDNGLQSKEKDSNLDGLDDEKSAISINDLTSALKLLPAKLLKILN